MKNIVLIGMPGSGKSTVGVLLAKALGYSFVDVDLIICKEAGKPLQEILDNKVLTFFFILREKSVQSLTTTRPLSQQAVQWFSVKCHGKPQKKRQGCFH